MLSEKAFNAFLKTLEEPPPHAKFVFATTEIRKVPVTVLSRCQRFDLRRVETDVLVAHLANIAAKEKVEAEPGALSLIARAAEGSVRDSLSLLDQAIAHAAGTVRAEDVRQMLGLADRARIIDLFEHLVRGDVAKAFAEFRDQYDTGADPVVVLSDLAEFVNFVTRVKVVPATADNIALAETERSRGREFAAKLSMRVLSRMWQMLLKGIAEVQAATRPAAAAEMVLVRIAYAADLPTPDEASARSGERRRGRRQALRAVQRAHRLPRRAACARRRAASRRRRATAPRMAASAPARAVGVVGAAIAAQLACGDRGACRREARPCDEDRARIRRPPGAHRGRPARNRAGAACAAQPGQRHLAAARAMDRQALDGRRLQRAGPADAARAAPGRKRRAEARRHAPIRGCRRC